MQPSHESTDESGKAHASFYRSLSEKHLSLIIFPTEQCNFRCTYCYEDFKLRRMSKETQNSIIKLISKRLPALTSIDVSWFGGEPLLAPEIISNINEFIQSNNDGTIDFSSNITTNGYLMSYELFDAMVALGISRWQVSIDGIGRFHDQTRKLANGHGTFDTIWRNLSATKASERDFEIMIRLHFHPGNIDSCAKTIKEFLHIFNGDPRYKIYLKNISHLGSKNDSSFKVFSWAETKKVKDSLASLIPNIHLWDGVNVFDKMYVCYAAQPNSIAIRSNGRLAKCTVALQSDKNDIGAIKDDGSLEIDHDKMRFWIRGLQSLNKAELACPMRE